MSSSKCVLFLSLAALGCASSGSVQVSSSAAQPKPENCEIELFVSEQDIKRPLERVCIVSARTGTSVFEDKSPEAAVKHAKAEACKCGADALVLTDMERQGVTWTGWGKSQVKATAIRFTDK